MADDVQRTGTNPKNEPAQAATAEDAETRATRQELKQSSLSDELSDTGEERNHDKDRPATPSLCVPETQKDELKEQISSPKKKRSYDQLEESQGPQEDDLTDVASSKSANSRTERDEPEKKRYREKKSSDTTQVTPLLETKDEKADEKQHDLNTESEKTPRDVPSLSFANSVFGQLASKASGFASLQPSQRKGFSSAASKSSSFNPVPSTLASEPRSGMLGHQPPTTVPKLSFTSSSGASPFAGLSSKTNGFGSIGFGLPSALSGSKPLGSFVSSGMKAAQNDKAARPFGAPDSDAGEDDDEDDEDDEDGEDEEDGEDGESEGQLHDKIRRASPDKDGDDKKRLKLQKIEVDDGEAGEITVLSVRAKMFSLDKQSGWKERGAGMLKINVPHACVEFDYYGAVIPGSFDASGLYADEKTNGVCESKVARLILRQDQTHRVILNTAILPAMEFQEKSSLKSVGILFTAFEGNGTKPVSITVRMSAASAKQFLNEIHSIQRELRGH
ncbi:hypothetical protein E4U42_002031 [Claviceps africana]|uniref:RanBD1 domain-containing protein n=1 Tax=Claviceps africana TaxID=83212 RepID=A0A8K0J8R5_9HYPO|nr:hypothetical protein E4U42_002031 [Claviceps africana]